MTASGIDRDATVQPRPLVGVTGFKRDLLLTVARLSGTNPYGQVIKQALEREYGESVNHGRLYQNLDELVDAGFVRKVPLDGRTNAYRLTATADSELRAHREWEEECLTSVDDEDLDRGGDLLE